MKKPFLELHRNKEWIVSITLLSACISSLFVGPFADKFGRKPVIIFSDLCFTIGKKNYY